MGAFSLSKLTFGYKKYNITKRKFYIVIGCIVYCTTY
jgi:hypothetical protein